MKLTDSINQLQQTVDFLFENAETNLDEFFQTVNDQQNIKFLFKSILRMRKLTFSIHQLKNTKDRLKQLNEKLESNLKDEKVKTQCEAERKMLLNRKVSIEKFLETKGN